jgi:hypothetical protein
MSKCEHGLTSKECYVCASPKYGETLRFKGHRLPPDDTALLRQALEALEFESSGYCGGEQTERALTALRERLGEKK